MLPSIHHALKFFSAFLIFKWDYWYCWICTGSASCGRYQYSNRHLWLHWKDWSGWGWGRGLSFNGIIIIIITIMRLLVVVVVFLIYLCVSVSKLYWYSYYRPAFIFTILYNLNTDLWPRKPETPILIYEHFELQNLLFSDVSICQINLYFYISEMSYDNDNILSTGFHHFDGFIKGLRS